MPDDYAEILAGLRDYLASVFSVPASAVQIHSRLDDLGLDSLDTVEVAAALMDIAGGDGAWGDYSPVTTVLDLVTLVAKTRA